eukprot:1364119-Pyramimonas_sp.AAC.1
MEILHPTNRNSLGIDRAIEEQRHWQTLIQQEARRRCKKPLGFWQRLRTEQHSSPIAYHHAETIGATV